MASLWDDDGRVNAKLVASFLRSLRRVRLRRGEVVSLFEASGAIAQRRRGPETAAAVLMNGGYVKALVPWGMLSAPLG